MGGDFSSTGLSRYDARLSLRERHMRRREFITLVGAAAAWPLSVRAQQPAHKLARIGLLQPSLDNPIVARGYPAFLEEMKKSGFSEGQNLTIRFVRLDQDSQGLFAETAELLQKVDLVVSVGAEAALQAVLAASRTIPVVIWAINYDPVALGYVNSLVRPGGNITGIVSLQTELAAKQVELLTQAFPGRTRLGIFWDQISGDQFAAAERQARSLGLDVRPLKLEHPPYDFDAAFQRLSEGSPQMLLLLSSPFFAPARSRIADLAIQQRLPTMFIFKTYVEAGGLMSYGVNAQANYRQLGFYAAKILNGATPADLPVQQAVQFELVINLKTAKAIGVDVSTAIQLRADEVIE
jgi:putative ABC transport system substrate-binding protein